MKKHFNKTKESVIKFEPRRLSSENVKIYVIT